ncbi:MAG: hypothetical protein ACREK5_06470 [Gemmatimonadota bacterium]
MGDALQSFRFKLEHDGYSKSEWDDAHRKSLNHEEKVKRLDDATDGIRSIEELLDFRHSGTMAERIARLERFFGS